MNDYKELIPSYYEPAPDANRSPLSKHVATQFWGAYTMNPVTGWPGNLSRVYSLVHDDMQRLVKSLEDRIIQLEEELEEEVISGRDLQAQLCDEEADNVRLRQKIRDLEMEASNEPRWTF